MNNRKPYVNCLDLAHQGKVRDMYFIPVHDKLRLMVATDAISTHNIIHKNMIPGKGYVLTALSIFFALKVIPTNIDNHIVAFGKKIYDYLPKDRTYPEDFHLRAVVIKVLKMVYVEFIWRMYMAGSLWKKYYSKGKPNPYGLLLPDDLLLMSRFKNPIFTPTDKSENDDPLDSEQVKKDCTEAAALSLAVYNAGREHANRCGIEIIDFKCEVGRDEDGAMKLGDEWLNGDCCRFVEKDKIILGQNPPWMDKEIFRKAAEEQWGGEIKAPIEFSTEVVKKGSKGYYKSFEILSGQSLEQFQKEYLV